MEVINIEDLNINVSQQVTGIRVIQAKSIERVETGIVWKGRVDLMAGDRHIESETIRRVMRQATTITFNELDIEAAGMYSKNYADLLVSEVDMVQGFIIAKKVITAISGVSGVVIDNIPALVERMLTAINS